MTEQASLPKSGHAFVVANPASGSYGAKSLQRALDKTLAGAGWSYELHEIRGDEGEEVARRVREAIGSGADIAVAYGGDGTVSAVANGVVGTAAALVIIPGGTGNALAGQLHIPHAPEEALALVTGPHVLRPLDALRVNGHHYVLNVSTGLTPIVMRETSRASKRLLGQAAYLIRGAREFVGFQPHSFSLEIDGRHQVWRASEVLISNASLVGGTPLRWELDVEIGDGEFLVSILYARTAWHLLKILVSMFTRGEHIREVHYAILRDHIRVEAEQRLMVEGDGEAIGATPFEAQVVIHALRAVAPAAEAPKE